MIILNSAEAVSDLMDKRSAIYSDRPRLPLVDLSVKPRSFSFVLANGANTE